MNGQKELLSSDLHPDGVWHARYPTATRTLCSLPVVEPRGAGYGCPPTCGRCSRIARLFHRVDASMPAAWLPEAHAA